MKLLTLNVWQGRLEKILLQHLEALNFDFACMQEAVSYAGDSAGLVTSYKKIGKSLMLEEQFFSPLMSTTFGSKAMTFGNVIYSRTPFSQTDTVFTRGEHNADFDFDSDDYNIRAFQHAALDVNGKKLHLLNHHGHHINAHKLGDKETLHQVHMIIDYIQQLEGAVILCGDFNLAPESESIELLSSVLRNLSVEYSLPTTRSRLTYKDEVCDYIFVNNHIDVTDFTMDETIVSDHNALVLNFEVNA